MAKNTKLILEIFSIAIVLVFARCASQLPPDGGEVDKEPPKIVAVTPANGTVNYKEDYFEITFSEYVDKKSVQDAVFISPALKNILKYDWSGKTVTVYFNDTLKAGMTYTVSIGSEVRDINNANKMNDAVSFAFSTGEKIDKGEINGIVYGEKLEGVSVFAFKENGKELNPEKNKPDYISQVGVNGKYNIPGIADGNYYVFAIRDKFRDMLYQKNEDEFGIQSRKIELKDQFNRIEQVDFFLTSEDTIAPNVSTVFTKDRNHIQITFSKAVDSSKINSSNFLLIDTTNGKAIKPDYFFKGEGKLNQYSIAFKDTMEKKEGWILISKNISDLFTNILKEEKTSVFVKTDKDTNTLKLIKIVGNSIEGKVDYERPKIILEFNDAVDLTTVKEKSAVVDANENKIKYEIEKIDDAAFALSILEKLKQSSEYIYKLDLRKFTDSFGNKIDSLFQNKFSTTNELDFSGASGTITLKDTVQTIAILESASFPKKFYKQKINSKHQFDFKKVYPGKYLAWVFKDINHNNKYDFGKISPFKYSEEFKYYPDTLNLRARWPVGNISIDFQK